VYINNIYSSIQAGRGTAMKISINADDLDQFKFFLNTLLLGGVTALLQKKANIDDIEYLMFGPKSIELLKLIPVESVYSDLIHQGTEIEDIASLLALKEQVQFYLDTFSFKDIIYIFYLQ